MKALLITLLCLLGGACQAAPIAWDIVVRDVGGIKRWYGCTLYSEEQSYINGWPSGYIEASCEGKDEVDEIDWNHTIQGLPTLRLHVGDAGGSQYHDGCRTLFRHYQSSDETGTMVVDCEIVYQSNFGG